MPEPVPKPTPATPDELAALYLRARDVPCPGCGYNRRDGNSAACPECATAIKFMSQTQLLRTKHRVWAAVVTIALVASSSAVSVNIWRTVFADISSIIQKVAFWVLPVSVVFNLLALQSLFALRREHPTNPGRPLFRLLITLAVAGILQTMMLNAFWYAPYW